VNNAHIYCKMLLRHYGSNESGLGQSLTPTQKREIIMEAKNYTTEELLNLASFLTTGIYSGPTAPLEEAVAETEKRIFWDYLSFLWLGPATFLKGKEWAEENEEKIKEWAAYLLILLVVIAIVIFLAKK